MFKGVSKNRLQHSSRTHDGGPRGVKGRSARTLVASSLLGVAYLVFWSCACLAQEAVTPTPSAPVEEGGARSKPSQPKLPRPPEDQDIEATVFDLFLADTLQGSILVRYTDDWFEIDDPKDVVAQLKEVNAEPRLVELFQGRIDKVRTLTGLGTVQYDLRTFRIIVRLDPSLLPVHTLSIGGRLPDPEKGISLLQGASVAGSGKFGDTFNGSFTHRTQVSSGRFVGQLEGTAVQDRDYILTEASVGGILGSVQTKAGLLQTKGQSFASSVEIAGVGVESAENLVLDRDSAHGSNLQIFVPSRARVEFYRDTRLLSVQVLDFGLQDIDTRTFPDGSYDVDVVITGDNGVVTRDRRFFTKEGSLAIRSHPVLYAQAGVARDRLDIISLPVYEMGVRSRATDVAELRGSLYGTDRISIAETGVHAVYRDYIGDAGFSASTEGNTAILGGLSGTVERIRLSVGGSKTLNGSTRVATMATPIPTPNSVSLTTPPQNADQIEQRINSIADTRSTISSEISTTLGAFDIRFSASRNQRNVLPIAGLTGTDLPTKEVRSTYGPRLTWRIFEDQSSSLRLDSSFLRTDEGNSFGVTVAYRLRFGEHTDLSSTVQSTGESKRRDNFLLTTASYDDRAVEGKGARVLASNELHQTSGTNSDRFVVDQFDGSYTNQFATTSGFIRDVHFGKSDGSFGGVNAGTSFLITPGAHVKVSYPAKKEAILIAEVQSKTSEDTFEILLNNQSYGIVKAGETAVVGVQPFRTYNVAIKPVVGSKISRFDEKVYTITFFPGNIVRKVWNVERVLIAVGKVVDQSGHPLPLKRIKGTKDYTVTEEDGTFQMEIAGTEELTIDSKDLHCKLNISLPEKLPEYLIDLGNVPCI